MYDRAKRLYDFDYEGDKITTIQSALLLELWCTQSQQDTSLSWYWSRAAISTAQSIDLHRDSDLKMNRAITSQQRALRSNIWWACVFRDRWLSFGHGKSLRINAGDCDVPMPSANCMLEPSYPLPSKWEKYLPAELSQVNPTWQGLLNLSVVLGDILSTNGQLQASAEDTLRIHELEMRIAASLPPQKQVDSYSHFLMFFESYARFHVE